MISCQNDNVYNPVGNYFDGIDSMMSIKEQLNTNIPKHVAIIMDGNGRWAKNKGLLRALGHESGTKTVNRVVDACRDVGIKYLTLYAFSTENWSRPKLEVDALMRLLVKSLKRELTNFIKGGIRLNVIGNIDALPKKVKEELLSVMEKTKGLNTVVLTLALSYGSREELVNTVKEIAEKAKNNLISPHLITEDVIKEHLYTKDIPDVDLLIRTSGEQRISNFLLWQIAYAEMYFTPVLWPDFKEEDLYEALLNYQQRERRFGKTSEQLS